MLITAKICKFEMSDLKLEDASVRLATNRDRNKIISLVTAVLSEFGLQPDFETSESDLLDIEATYFQNGGFFKIVENKDNQLFGTFAVYPVDEKTCKLRKMYLAPHVRGCGLGKRMLERAFDDARKSGFATMILETMPAMKDAIRLYTRRGFWLINRQPESPRCELVFALDLTKN